MRRDKVLSILGEVYSRILYMEERGRLGKYEGVSRWIWEENESRS